MNSGVIGRSLSLGVFLLICGTSEPAVASLPACRDQAPAPDDDSGKNRVVMPMPRVSEPQSVELGPRPPRQEAVQ